MSNILEQINSLTEQFSNLFEVEGLGDPASDVPPSTNKIKKDRKTKDGKVELVSVEDELFPYDGNKREQYRQKIIDTINNMIQGTATLEDLLQIVRQKKAPLKEAMELMEDLFSTILKQPEEKQGSLVYKYHQAKNKENAGKDTYTQAKEEEKRKSKEEKGQEKTEQRKLYKGKTKEDWKQGRLMDQIARKAKSLGKVSDPAITKSIERNQMKKWKSEGFEGAIEILEEIINEVSVGALARATENNVKKRQEAHRKSTEALKKAHDNYEEQSREHPEDEPALYNAVSKLSSVTRKEGEKASHANDLANLNLPKDSKVSANKLFDKADKTYSKRGKAVDKALEKGKGRGDKEFDAPMKKYSRAVDLAVADPVVSRRTNGGANESYTLSELFDRPDLLDDISKTLTNKTIKQHLENQAKKLLGGKKKIKKENKCNQ